MPEGNTKISLSDGTFMPIIGYGTANIRSKDGNISEDAVKSVTDAIKTGYRFIDTAAAYCNEVEVGIAIGNCIKEGLVKREDLFICTKLWCTAHKRESVMKACKESLRKLNLDYLDLYLIHWPTAYEEDGDPMNPIDPKTGKLRYSDTHHTETWLGMQDVKDAGLARSIGVSNFNRKMLDEIIAMPCKHKPLVNQVECHVYLAQKKLHAYSVEKGILLNAYCPLGSPGSCSNHKANQPPVLKDSVVMELAKKYNKTAAQILLRYLIQREIPPIPKSVSPERMKENLDSLNFKISNEDMQELIALDKGVRYCLKTCGFELTDHPLYPFHDEY